MISSFKGEVAFSQPKDLSEQQNKSRDMKDTIVVTGPLRDMP